MANKAKPIIVEYGEILSFYETADQELSITNIVALVITLVIFIIVISIVIIAFSPLDFTGYLKGVIPLITVIIAIMISFIIIIIIFVYIPNIITRE